MTVYVDDMRMKASVPNGARIITARWSHLRADTDEELHAFAALLGLRRSWAQYPGTWKSHYDVTDPVRAKAIRLGAIPLRYLEDTPRLSECKRTGETYTAPVQQTLFDRED